jgi:hypothetical protein
MHAADKAYGSPDHMPVVQAHGQQVSLPDAQAAAAALHATPPILYQ